MTTTDHINVILPPRCGDCVRHRGSGEELLVAWAEGDYFAWSGWPPGTARLSEYDVFYRCTDEEHRLSVAKWRAMTPTSAGDADGGRRARVLRLYSDQPEDRPIGQVDALCKGSWALGSACGRCDRCIASAPEAAAIIRGLHERLRRETPTRAEWEMLLGLTRSQESDAADQRDYVTADDAKKRAADIQKIIGGAS